LVDLVLDLPKLLPELFSTPISEKTSYVNADSSNVANRSNNSSNANSSVSQLNLNNTSSDTNGNNGSQLVLC
jgi:hypothetical protein